MRSPIKVLQVVGGMDTGGTETWLMHVLRHIDLQKYQMDFLVHDSRTYAYSELIESYGSKIIVLPRSINVVYYAKKLSQIMKDGEYDAVHSHLQLYNGIIMKAAYDANVRVRISHSHTGKSESKLRPIRLGYNILMRYMISRYMTRGLFVSKEAGISLFGQNFSKDKRITSFYCGIGLDAFSFAQDRRTLRGELDLPQSTIVVGHVGSFMAVKNHRFMIEICKELIKMEPESVILFVGDGPLRKEIEELVRLEKLQSHIVFLGRRYDVPIIMKQVLDVLLLPSLYEGLPLVGIEAQAAGLKTIFSDKVTREVGIVDKLVTWVPLTESPAYWARKIIEVAKNTDLNQEEALSIVLTSKFNILHGVRQLIQYYD